MVKKINIAIDGYSSCGKSTLAKQLAGRVGYTYVDTGAMYRAIALYLLREGIVQLNQNINHDAVIHALDKINVDFKYDHEKAIAQTFLNGRNVEKQIRGMKVSSLVSKISVIKEIRHKLLAIQREIAQNKGVVMEGRDIGSVVLPYAELKIFLVADENERIDRRYKELIKKGVSVSKKEILENIRKRDHADTSRAENPLIKPADAFEIDNTNITQEEQLEIALDLFRKTLQLNS